MAKKKITFTLDPEMITKLRAQAAKSRRSMTTEVEIALERYLGD